jgi:hypothetical protein
MLNGNIFYHGTLKKTIVAFGRLFSDIYIDRKQGDTVNGETIQRLQVPLTYAPKEKWLVRIEQDPTLENRTQISLPRMSFEITSYGYDATRKTNRMQKITYGTGTDESWVYTPVPYNIEMSLYVISKNQEDGLQIIEQILPTFTPEYNLSINILPEINMVQDIPVILNSTSVVDEYDGSFEDRRFVTHTLNFTLKTNLYGSVSSQGKILEVNANIGVKEITTPNRIYTATGDITTATVSSENWENNF